MSWSAPGRTTRRGGAAWINMPVRSSVSIISFCTARYHKDRRIRHSMRRRQVAFIGIVFRILRTNHNVCGASYEWPSQVASRQSLILRSVLLQCSGSGTVRQASPELVDPGWLFLPRRSAPVHCETPYGPIGCCRLFQQESTFQVNQQSPIRLPADFHLTAREPANPRTGSGQPQIAYQPTALMKTRPAAGKVHPLNRAFLSDKSLIHLIELVFCFEEIKCATCF
jgi:hypothetical protein